MGLTIDTDRREVYWIVRSVEGASLFRAETADKLKYTEEVLPQKISSLQYSNMQGRFIEYHLTNFIYQRFIKELSCTLIFLADTSGTACSL